MAQQRVLLDVLGIVEEGHPLGPFLPPVVQANADTAVVAIGQEVYVTLKCVVRQVIGPPLPPA